jgi:hypothetical protein
MVLLASAYDQSRFFKAADLTQEKKLRIKEATEELIGTGHDKEKKLVVWFTNDEHGLVLNKTNNRALRAAFGDPVSVGSERSSSCFQPRTNSAASWDRLCGCESRRRKETAKAKQQRSQLLLSRRHHRRQRQASPTISMTRLGFE